MASSACGFRCMRPRVLSNPPGDAMKSILATRATAFAHHPLALACLVALGTASAGAYADQAADMQAKLDALQKQVSELQAQMSALAARPQKPEDKAAAPPGVQPRPGDRLTF